MCVLCSITLNSCWNPSISLVKKKKKNNKWITDGQRTRRRTGNSKIVAEWNVEIAQPASSIWLTHTWKSGRQADRHPFPFPFSTPVTHTLLPTLLPFLLERCAAAALYFSHLLSIFFFETPALFFVGHEWLVFPMFPHFFHCAHIAVCVCTWALSVEPAFVCKCGHLISICVLDCFALHLLIFAI